MHRRVTMRIKRVGLTAFLTLALGVSLFALDTAHAQFLNDWEGKWFAISTEFKGLCEGDQALVNNRKKPKGFLHIMNLIVDQGPVAFTARMSLRVEDQWESTELILFPYIGTGRDLLAWFQDPAFQFVSGYVRMVMAMDREGIPVAWAVNTTTGNYAECNDRGICCAGTLALKGKGVPLERVPPELR
jgi:hypothetical protein